MSVLKQLEDENSVFLEKSTDDQNKAHVAEIFKVIAEAGGETIKLGRFQGKNEAALGAFAQQLESAIKECTVGEKFIMAPIDNPIALLLAVQDEVSLVRF